MHIDILMDSSLGWYLTTFEVSSVTKLSSEKAIFSTKITQAWRVITHVERGLGGNVAHLNIYLHSKFHQDRSRNEQVIDGKPQTLTIERRKERYLFKWVLHQLNSQQMQQKHNMSTKFLQTSEKKLALSQTGNVSKLWLPWYKPSFITSYILSKIDDGIKP